MSGVKANTMVASERMGRVQAEERLKHAEDNLAAAEAAVRDMQLHLQSLPTTAVPIAESPRSANPRRYLSSHVPFSEFVVFLHHLRAIRPLTDKSKDLFPAPILTTLLAQTFIARAVIEDHDPTLRLDTAPDLSWLTRKGVSQAIISGELIIEPVPSSSISAHDCSLCGNPILAPPVPQSPSGSHFGPPPPHPIQRGGPSSRFSLKPFFNPSSSPSQALPSPTQSPLASPGFSPMSSIYIFRVAAIQSSDKEPRSYPLCKTGWCLERLRATCELWHFVRTGIIHVVWQGDDGYVVASESTTSTPRTGTGDLEVRPQEVVRRKSGWGLGFKLAGTGSGGERSGAGGGWTRTFGRSLPPSPGVEKGKELVLTEDDEPVEIDEKAKKVVEQEKSETGWGAPLELEQEKQKADEDHITSGKIEKGESTDLEGSKKEAEEQNAEGDVPTIHESGPSPSVPIFSTTTETAGASESEVDSLQPDLKLRGNDSINPMAGTDDGVLFSTPTGHNAELPDENAVLRVSTDALTPDVASLASPIPDTSPEASSSKRGRNALPPPPIPERVAARSRGSSSHTSLERAGSAAEKSETTLYPVDNEGRHLSDEAVPAADEKSTDASETATRPSLPSRPSLPPRRLKTPTSQVPESTGDGQKTFLRGDGWEVRTWKQVVKLKEEMWRARLGIVDS